MFFIPFYTHMYTRIYIFCNVFFAFVYFNKLQRRGILIVRLALSLSLSLSLPLPLLQHFTISQHANERAQCKNLRRTSLVGVQVPPCKPQTYKHMYGRHIAPLRLHFTAIDLFLFFFYFFRICVFRYLFFVVDERGS